MPDELETTQSAESATKSKMTSNLVSWGLGAGVCALIPIPFIDDWAVKRVRKAAYTAIWRHHEQYPTIEIHTGVVAGRKQRRGCLGTLIRIPLWLAKWLVLYPIKKILRKLFFVFAIHDAVNAFSDCYHCTYLFHTALKAGHVPKTEAEAIALHNSIRSTCKKAESRPIIQLIQASFKRGKRKLRAEGMRLYRIIRKDRDSANPDERLEEAVEGEAISLSPIAEELEHKLLLEKGYFENLAQCLLAGLAAAPTTEQPSNETTTT